MLHRSGLNDEAYAVLGAVRATRPNDPRALAVGSCLVQCCERSNDRFQRAESECRRALAIDPGCVDAWEVLARGQAIQESWARAAEACEGGLAVVPEGDWAYGGYLLDTLVESDLLLGDWSKADADIARMRAWGAGQGAPDADEYDVISLCWREQWEEALVRASRLLLTATHKDRSPRLEAVKFECAHRLGRAHLAGSFALSRLGPMEEHPFTRAWAQRIRGHDSISAAASSARSVPS